MFPSTKLYEIFIHDFLFKIIIKKLYNNELKII